MNETLHSFIEWSPAALGAGIIYLGTMLMSMKKQIDELHEWHAREDDDGVKLWYVRRSLEVSVEKLANNIAAQTTLLSKLVDKLERLDDDVRQVYNKKDLK